METSNVFYIVGICAGVLLGIALVALFAWITKKAGGQVAGIRRNKEENFDERQLLVRSKAYKYAFMFVIIYVALGELVEFTFQTRILLGGAGLFIGIFLAVVLFGSICIFGDAYMGLQENPKGIMIMFGLISALNLVIGISNVFEEDFSFLEKSVTMVNGQVIECQVLSVDNVNLIVGIMCVIVTLEFAIKTLYNKKRDSLDEDE